MQNVHLNHAKFESIFGILSFCNSQSTLFATSKHWFVKLYRCLGTVATVESNCLDLSDC